MSTPHSVSLQEESTWDWPLLPMAPFDSSGPTVEATSIVCTPRQRRFGPAVVLASSGVARRAKHVLFLVKSCTGRANGSYSEGRTVYLLPYVRSDRVPDPVNSYEGFTDRVPAGDG
jgi:hypothetical protein